MNTKDVVLIALFAALIVILSLMPPIPLGVVPVPITLQTLGVMLAGVMLGPWRSLLACLLYMLLWMLGLPVLPGGRGGLGALAGPTGGFLVGMVLGAFVVGWLAQRFTRPGSSVARQTGRYFVACLVGGVLVVYAVGIPWLNAVTGIGWQKAFLGSMVFVPGDAVKALVAAYVATQVRRAWPMPLR